MQQEMSTISVVFNWCSATRLGSAWGVTWEIRNPLCAPFDALGQPCPRLPVQANFYHYDVINRTVAADAATELLLLTY